MFVPSFPTVMETGWPVALLICNEAPGRTLVKVLDDDVTRVLPLERLELPEVEAPRASMASWPRVISCSEMPAICEPSTIILPA